MSDKPNEIIGTTKAGYLPPKKGPFLCVRCIHFKSVDSSCDHPDVIEDAKKGQIPIMGNKAIVAESGCCTYFNPGNEKTGIGRFMTIQKPSKKDDK